ncbi:hypothetical protein MBLNU230_g3489t1 [Neophaeotheca triangularis]
MKSTLILGLVGACAAAPLTKRQMLSDFSDADVLNYALTLEHLEAAFYAEGLKNYTQGDFANAGFDETFYKNLQEIAYDEQTHVSFLSGALTSVGAEPVQPCTYAWGVDTVQGFVATSQVLEGVGVSAYLGAAQQIMNKDYLTAAGSILTVEARHSAYIRAALEQIPFPSPFDAPLTPNEVFTLASSFIVTCPPSNPGLPLKSFPKLAVTSTGTVTSGSNITVETQGYTLAPKDAHAGLFAAFVSVTGPVYAPLQAEADGRTFQVTVPDGVNGQSYLLFTSCDEGNVNDASTVAGPVVVEVSNPIHRFKPSEEY